MKSGIREKLLKSRDGMKPAGRKAKESAIRKRLFALSDFKKAADILFYASFRSEVDTLECMSRALKTGKKITLPLVDKDKKELKLYGINGVPELVPGYKGIPEPGITENRRKRLKDVDVVIIPGAGFDVTGNRLGYGFGYYDKLLSGADERVVKIALAFERQIIPSVPNESHDIKVDKIVTEKRVINCKK